MQTFKISCSAQLTAQVEAQRDALSSALSKFSKLLAAPARLEKERDQIAERIAVLEDAGSDAALRELPVLRESAAAIERRLGKLSDVTDMNSPEAEALSEHIKSTAALIQRATEKPVATMLRDTTELLLPLYKDRAAAEYVARRTPKFQGIGVALLCDPRQVSAPAAKRALTILDQLLSGCVAFEFYVERYA
jgi:hypothetical protein